MADRRTRKKILSRHKVRKCGVASLLSFSSFPLRTLTTYHYSLAISLFIEPFTWFYLSGCHSLRLASALFFAVIQLARPRLCETRRPSLARISYSHLDRIQVTWVLDKRQTAIMPPKKQPDQPKKKKATAEDKVRFRPSFLSLHVPFIRREGTKLSDG